MAFQPAPDLAEVIIKGKLDNEDAFLTLGFVNLTSWGASDLAALANGVGVWFANNGLPNLPETYQYQHTVARDLRTADGFEATDTFAQGETGSLASPQLPNNNTIAISFRTGRIGRSQRGRNYWPGLVEADVLNNLVLGTRTAPLISFYQGFIGLSTRAPNWRWVVISRWKDKALRPAALSTPVTAVTITDSFVDSQRRRLPSRGN